MVGNGMEGSGSELTEGTVPAFALEGLAKTMKTLSQHSRSPGRDLNSGSPEYEAGMSTTRP
jgi:hypothetical protein